MRFRGRGPFVGRESGEGCDDGGPKLSKGARLLHFSGFRCTHCVAPGAWAKGVPASSLALAGNVWSFVAPVGSTHGH